MTSTSRHSVPDLRPTDSDAAAPILAARKRAAASRKSAKARALAASPGSALASSPSVPTPSALDRYAARIESISAKLSLTPEQKESLLTDSLRNEIAMLGRLPILSALPFATTLDTACAEEIPGGIQAALDLLEWEPSSPAVTRLLDSIHHTEQADPEFSRASVSLNDRCRKLRIPPLEIYEELVRVARKLGAYKAAIRSATAQEQITARSVAEALLPGQEGFEDRKIHLQAAGIAPVPKTAITNISGHNIGGIALIGSQNGLPAFEKDVLDLDRRAQGQGQPPAGEIIEGRLSGASGAGGGEPTFDPDLMGDSEDDDSDLGAEGAE